MLRKSRSHVVQKIYPAMGLIDHAAKKKNKNNFVKKIYVLKLSSVKPILLRYRPSRLIEIKLNNLNELYDEPVLP